MRKKSWIFKQSEGKRKKLTASLTLKIQACVLFLRDHQIESGTAYQQTEMLDQQ